MNFNSLISVFVFIAGFMWVSSNFLRYQVPQPAVNNSQVTINSFNEELAEEGFNLQALPAILKEAKSAEDLEKRINQPEGINNLDLNNDGKVDFISVTEFGEREKNRYGFSFTTEVEKGEVQEIATVEINKEGEEVNVNTYGNNQVYGNGVAYRSSFPFGSFLLMSYFLNSRSLYASPYGYSRYPSYHSSYSRSSKSDYASRVNNYNQKFSSKRTTPANSSPSMKSPNGGKSANSGIRRNLRNPSASQKSFGQRSRQSVKNGGFGRGSSLSKNNSRRSPFFGKRNSRRSSSFFGRRRSLGGFRGFSGRRSFRGFGRGFGGFRGFRR